MGFTANKEIKYTYQDYQLWSSDEPWEIIDGSLYAMSPAPKVKYQRIIGEIFKRIADPIEKKGCRVFLAPTDVVFDESNVVQPDIFVVCEKQKITERNIRGAPNLIIEVISPGTEVKDRREKKQLYEKFQVREYLIIFPESEYVEQYCLKRGRYSGPRIFNWDEKLKLFSFEIELCLWDIFEREQLRR
jgi:Uma2 family endonuclease